MTKSIAVFTGTRAEYGLLVPIIRAIAQSDELELRLIVSGAHVSALHGMTIDTIREDGFSIDLVSETLLASDSAGSAIKAMALGMLDISRFIQEQEPDALVLLGDRFEVLSAATAALMHSIPIVHLHGGELTLGAFDDSIRHAVTKMSHIHVVATDQFRDRVIQMGESPDAVHVCQAPGVEVARTCPPLSMAEIADILGRALTGPSCVVSYHSTTRPGEDASDTANAILDAVRRKDMGTSILTLPNADPNRSIVAQTFAQAADDEPDRFVLLSNVAHRTFLSLVRSVDVMIGNSSSGIIEAPIVGTPTVNVGMRQDGRPRAPSTVDVAPDRTAIESAIHKALSMNREQLMSPSPYDGGIAMGSAVVRVLESIDLPGLLAKGFHDA